MEKQENDFLEWLSGADIYVGYCRYGHLGGHGFVVVSNYDGNDELAELVLELNAGDIEAGYAEKYIKEKAKWIFKSQNPATAMADLVDAMRKYYFDLP